MNTIVVDAETLRKLRHLVEALQIIDESGRILGTFTPIPGDSRREPKISEEEIERRIRAGGGRSLAEIMSNHAWTT
jgi:hypothetical protein